MKKSFLQMWSILFSVEASKIQQQITKHVCRGFGFKPHWRHCVVSLSKNINPSLVLVQPRKTRPYITERLLMGRKESNQTNKTKHVTLVMNSNYNLM